MKKIKITIEYLSDHTLLNTSRVEEDVEIDKNLPLWRTLNGMFDESYRNMRIVMKRTPDMTVGEFIKGGDKRMPVGVENASKALVEASVMLDSMNIRHYLAFGTCLGIVRDKKLIKHDWDVDLIMLGEDLPKFKPELLEEYGFEGYKLKQDIPRWKKDGKESEECYVRTISFWKYGVRVDIDPAHISTDGKSRLLLKGRKREKFAAEHPREWFDNAVSVNFKGKDFLIPSPVEEYLFSNYGAGWINPVYGPMDWVKRPCMREEYECKKEEENIKTP